MDQRKALYRPSAYEVACLTIHLLLAYEAEKAKGKKNSRFRISRSTLRKLACRRDLRSSFVEEWIYELSNIGWSAFSIDDGFGIIYTSATQNWVKIAAKRLDGLLHRVSSGDHIEIEKVVLEVESAMIEEEAAEEE